MPRISYSVPCKSYFRVFKKLFSGCLKAEREEIFADFLASSTIRIYESGESSAFGYDLFRLISLYENRFTSVFFENYHLKEFLLSTEVSDLHPIYDYIFEHGQTIKMYSQIFEYVKTTAINNEAVTPLVEKLLSCSDTELHCVAYHLRIPFETDAITVIAYADSNRLIFDVTQDENSFIIKIKTDTEDFSFKKLCSKIPDEYRKELIKVFINFIYYIQTFPDALIEGAPKNAVMIDQKEKKKSIRIKTVPAILEDDKPHNLNQQRVTHFRKGFFRYLKSDYFKNKKNQWVFVKAALVKGAEAKTLI